MRPLLTLLTYREYDRQTAILNGAPGEPRRLWAGCNRMWQSVPGDAVLLRDRRQNILNI